MKTLYIYEGPDGSGKSTMVKSIADVYRYYGVKAQAIHFGSPEPGQTSILSMFRPAVEALITTADVVIMDRSPVSELVYGEVLRGDVIGSVEEWEEWNRISSGDLRLFGQAVDVRRRILDAPLEVLRQRAYGDRGEDFVPPAYFENIVNKYREVARDLVSTGWFVKNTSIE